MKRTLLILAALITASTLMAQEVLLRKDDKVVNLGVGLGSTFYSGGFYTTQIPPISASFELGFMDDVLDVTDLTLGLGGYLAFSKAKQEWTSPSIGHYGYEYTYFILGGRALLHYPLVDNLDTYTGLMLGARINSSHSFGTPESSASASGSGIAYSWFLGGRYYFTDNLALMAELGYGISYLNLGVAFKF